MDKYKKQHKYKGYERSESVSWTLFKLSFETTTDKDN